MWLLMIGKKAFKNNVDPFNGLLMQSTYVNFKTWHDKQMVINTTIDPT